MRVGRQTREVPRRVHRAAAVGLVLVTGAAGRIGTVLRGALPERGWSLRSLDVIPVQDERPGEEQIVADVTDLAAMVDAAQGADAVVHLAGVVGESTGRAISHANIEGTYVTLEAARRAGVPRVVLASSNHASGFTPRPGEGLLREEDAPPRPDTYYGIAKVTMEALGSLYHDRYGMDVVCLRIGSAFPEPTTVRQLATWLSPADTVSLVDAALRAPSPGFSVVWGVSAPPLPRPPRPRAPPPHPPHRAAPPPRPGPRLRAGRRRRGLRRSTDRGVRRARSHRSRARAGRRRVHVAGPRRGELRARVGLPVNGDLLVVARDWADDDPHDGDR